MKDIHKCRLKRKEVTLRKKWGSERIRNRHTGNTTEKLKMTKNTINTGQKGIYEKEEVTFNGILGFRYRASSIDYK
jgi:hypothetical protein